MYEVCINALLYEPFTQPVTHGEEAGAVVLDIVTLRSRPFINHRRIDILIGRDSEYIGKMGAEVVDVSKRTVDIHVSLTAIGVIQILAELEDVTLIANLHPVHSKDPTHEGIYPSISTQVDIMDIIILLQCFIQRVVGTAPRCLFVLAPVDKVGKLIHIHKLSLLSNCHLSLTHQLLKELLVVLV